MRSRLAEQLAAERLAEELAMTPEQRVHLALRLGDEAVDLYRQLHPEVTEEQVDALFAAHRAAGRRRSTCVSDG